MFIRKYIAEELDDLEHSGLWKLVDINIVSKYPKIRWFSIIRFVYVDEYCRETKLNYFEKRRFKKVIRKAK